MPVTQAQLLAGAAYQRETYTTSAPVDSFNEQRPFAKWLVEKSKPSFFGNGIFNELVKIENDSNYQNYTGDDEVTFNKKNTDRKAPFYHYEAHDGFTLNETELADNGIIMTTDTAAVITGAEKDILINKVRDGQADLKEGFQYNWDLEMHRSNVASPKACPGLDAFVSLTPNTGVVGLDAATYPLWRNYTNLGIATTVAGTLTSAMQDTARLCALHGALAPDAIFCGKDFWDAYLKDSLAEVTRQLVIAGNKSSEIDNSVSKVYFKGLPLIHDPTFELLDTLDAPASPWTKRCYFLQSKSLRLRPVKGRWLINRNPPMVYNRFTHYFGLTADYGLTMNQRNTMAVLSIA